MRMEAASRSRSPLAKPCNQEARRGVAWGWLAGEVPGGGVSVNQFQL